MNNKDTILHTEKIRNRLIDMSNAVLVSLDVAGLFVLRAEDYELRKNIEKGYEALCDAQQFFNKADALNAERANAAQAALTYQTQQQADKGPSFHRSELIAKIAEAMASADTGSVTTIKIRSGGYTVNTKTG